MWASSGGSCGRVPHGAANAARLVVTDEDSDSGLPADAIATLKVLVGTLTRHETGIDKRHAEIARRAKENKDARRLMAVPGIGRLIATAIAVVAPPPWAFRKVRDFAASWCRNACGVTLDLTRRKHSTGGKQRLWASMTLDERSLRLLPSIGANGVFKKRHIHAAARPGTWPFTMCLSTPPASRRSPFLQRCRSW